MDDKTNVIDANNHANHSSNTRVRNDVMDAIHPRDTGHDTGVRNDVTDTNVTKNVTKNSTSEVETPTYIEIT